MALVLTRRPGESIMIGDNIIVTYVKSNFGGNQVTLAIEAPKEVPVHREEVLERIKAEQHKSDSELDESLDESECNAI